MKGYLGFVSGMTAGLGREDPNGMTYMDWERAEKICLENPNSTICAGLREDWGYTSGLIFDNGDFYGNENVYGCSRWATPILDIDGEEVECYTRKKTSKFVPKWWGKRRKGNQKND